MTTSITTQLDTLLKQVEWLTDEVLLAIKKQQPDAAWEKINQFSDVLFQLQNTLPIFEDAFKSLPLDQQRIWEERIKNASVPIKVANGFIQGQALSNHAKLDLLSKTAGLNHTETYGKYGEFKHST